MKTLNFENLCEVVLSDDEMMMVRGGLSVTEQVYENDTNPTKPPIVIEL